MGQYVYVPDPGEQRLGFSAPVPDRLAQLRHNQQMQTMPPPSPAMPPQPVPAGMGPVSSGGPQNSGIIWVSGKSEADGYLVAPNSAVALWDANNPVIYLRQADSTGKPSTKVYDLVERTENQPAPQSPQVDMSQYVTIEQLENILAERLKRPAKAVKQKEDTDNG